MAAPALPAGEPALPAGGAPAPAAEFPAVELSAPPEDAPARDAPVAGSLLLEQAADSAHSSAHEYLIALEGRRRLAEDELERKDMPGAWRSAELDTSRFLRFQGSWYNGHVTGALFQPFPMQPGRRAQAWRHQPAFLRPRHFHAEPELNLVTRGSATFGIGDEQITLARGDVVLFHPGQDHVLLSASADLGLFAVALLPELALRVCGALSPVRSRGFRMSESETSAAEEALSQLGGTGGGGEVEVPLAELFRSARARSAQTHVLSRLALQHLNADPSVSGEQLGSAVRAQPSALSRHFHDDMGIRLVEYRARLRLISFVHWVDQGHSLGRAALDAGFGSYAQCHRVFQSALGCSPRHYFNGQRRAIDDALTAPT